MNLQTLPPWAWIAIAAIGFLLAKKKGWLDAKPPTEPEAARKRVESGEWGVERKSNPPAQVVELRHVLASPPAASDATPAANPLTETRRVNFGFDVEVTPRPLSPEKPA